MQEVFTSVYLGICSNILSNISDAKLEIDIPAIISLSENKNNYRTLHASRTI